MLEPVYNIDLILGQHAPPRVTGYFNPREFFGAIYVSFDRGWAETEWVWWSVSMLWDMIYIEADICRDGFLDWCDDA